MNGWLDSILDVLASRMELITNLDLDGVLCAAIVCKNNPNSSVSGYSDSSTQFYRKRGIGIDEMLCLDLNCTRRGLACIDNHIVSISPMGVLPDKYNPNTVRGVSLANYTHKYPFSTFMLLCAVYDRFGGEAIDIDHVVGMFGGQPVYLWELILRADDTLYTSRSAYMENAADWWVWLLSISGSGGNTERLYDKCRLFGKTEAYAEKCRINAFLKSEYRTTSLDGFVRLCDDYYRLAYDIGKAFSLKLNMANPTQLELYGFVRILYKTRDTDFFRSVLDSGKIFSYAFSQSDTLSVSVCESKLDYFLNLKYKCSAVDFPMEKPPYRIPYKK